MKTAFITDIHLNDREVHYLKEKRKELLTNFVDKHINELNQVIFGWDIFDTINIDTSSEVAKFFFHDIISRLLNKWIKVDIVVWNHERLWRKNVYSILSNGITNSLLTIHNEMNYRIGENYNEIFLPFVYPSDLCVDTIEDSEKEVKRKIELFIKEIKTINKNPIVLYNHNCMGATWFDLKNEINVDLSKIKWLDLILWGHIHKHIEITKNSIYVWSLMRSFHYEEESEGYYIFDINNNKIQWEYHSVESFEYKKIELRDDEEYEFKDGVVYTINFKIKNPKDKFYITNTLRKCNLSWGHVKSYKHEQISTKRNMHEVKVSIMQTNEEILKYFMKENKIKNEELKDYLTKLAYCSGWVKYKNISDAVENTKTEHIENMKVRKTRRAETKYEKKQKEWLKKLKDSISTEINSHYVL